MLGIWSILDESRAKVGVPLVMQLAKALALGGKRVLVLELCPMRPALDIALGVDEKVVYTLSDIGKVAADQLLLSPQRDVLFVPSALDASADEISPDALAALIRDSGADIVLLLLERAFYPVAQAVSDGVLLLTDPSLASLRASAAFTAASPVMGCVLSDFVATRHAVSAMPPLRSLADMLGSPLVGILPRLTEKNTRGVKRKDFLLAVRNLAARLSGTEVPLLRGIAVRKHCKRAFFEG